MNDTAEPEIEALLRETLRERAIAAPVGDSAALADRALTMAHTQRRRRVGAGVGAGVAAAVVVVASVVGLPWRAPAPRSADLPTGPVATPVATPSTSPWPSPSGTPDSQVPSGWHSIWSRGIQVAVPGDWELNPQRCGRTTPAAFFGEGPEPLPCPPPSTVEARAYAPELGIGAVDDQKPDADARRRTLIISGIAAERVDGLTVNAWTTTQGDASPTPTSVSYPITILRIPDYGQVTITGADAELVDQLLSTVRLSEIDASGCARKETPVSSVPIPAPSSAAGVETVSVCAYSQGLLASSGLLRGPEAQSLAQNVALAVSTPQICAGEPMHDLNVRLIVSGSAIDPYDVTVAPIQAATECGSWGIRTPWGSGSVTVGIATTIGWATSSPRIASRLRVDTSGVAPDPG